MSGATGGRGTGGPCGVQGPWPVGPGLGRGAARGPPRQPSFPVPALTVALCSGCTLSGASRFLSAPRSGEERGPRGRTRHAGPVAQARLPPRFHVTSRHLRPQTHRAMATKCAQQRIRPRRARCRGRVISSPVSEAASVGGLGHVHAHCPTPQHGSLSPGERPRRLLRLTQRSAPLLIPQASVARPSP